MQHVYNQSYLDPSQLEEVLLAMIRDNEKIISVTRISEFISTGDFPNLKDRACYLIITETNAHKER